MARTKVSIPVWSSQWVFIMAAVGSAVGLGNIWKFPYIAGDNGGGAFVIVYLACILLIGLPILIAEISLGRAGKANPVQAMRNNALNNNASKAWTGLGINGVIAGLLILSFYTVIAGLALAYFFKSLQGGFLAMDANEAQALFNSEVASPWVLGFWHTLFMLFTLLIVARGVRAGLEKAINFMMPGLLMILLVLLGYATMTGSFGQSVSFMFRADFSQLTWNAVLVAMGHAFFTLSIGLGTMMAYGAYVGRKMSIVQASVWIVVMDTLIAIMAGLIIFSIVFANALEPGAGPGLLFQTLPIAFGQMAGGWFFGSLFFLLVVMAALSSAISLLEPAVSWLEQRGRYSRAQATALLGAFTWFIGLGTVLSFNYWESVYIFGERNVFATLDFLTSSLMLPLGGLLIAVFAAWTWQKSKRTEVLHFSNQLFQQFFDTSLRYFTPFAVLVVFAFNLALGWLWTSVILSVGIVAYLGYAWRCHQTQAG